MSGKYQNLISNLGALVILAVALFVFMRGGSFEQAPATSTSLIPVNQTAAANVNVRSTSSTSVATSAIATRSISSTTAQKTSNKANKSTPPAATSTAKIARIKNLYPFPPLSFSTINDSARSALINILCAPRSGSLRPISGSGVIIDPRGVVLTNAHVAQYVLLSESTDLDLSCTVRTGSPATARWHVEVLFLPPVWIAEHASEMTAQHGLGTGEHDYALLRITDSIDGSPLPSTFPFLAIDTREGAGFIDDGVLIAAYPAEFIGGIAAQLALYPVSSGTSIRQLLTFSTSSVDLISLGGTVVAQGGSSGGATVNAWGRLIGIIVTTSDALTTGARDLRALTLNYINRDIALQSKFDLAAILSGDPVMEADSFNSNIAPTLMAKLLAQLNK